MIVTDKDARNGLVAKLKIRREALGLSQEILGQQIGTPKQLIGEWERGEVTPNLSSLIRWSKALDCRLDIEFEGPL